MNRHKSIRKPGRLNKKIADVIDISKDVILDTFRIVMTGTKEMTVENHKGILEYSDNLIKLKANPENIEIHGSKLELSNISDDALSIRGNFLKIFFAGN